MFFFVDTLVLAALFGLAAAFAEIESFGMGIHIGSGLAVAFGSWPLLWLAEPFINEVQEGSARDAVAILLSVLAAWLITQIVSRWFYSADTRQANIMALTVGVGKGLTLLFLRWAVST
jgi:hypothetical protein